MAVSTRVEPIDRDIALIFEEELAPAARAAKLATFAQDQIDDVRMHNARIIGEVPDYETIVDGKRGAPVTSVRAEGVIVAEYDLLLEVFAWIGAQLVATSPVLTGLYSRSHVFFADGIEVDPMGPVPEASEYVFLNAQPYARKIERGLSAQATHGVYQALAVVANRRFGNIAMVTFGYRTMAGGAIGNWAAGRSSRASKVAHEARQPAIIIRMGR